MDARRGSGKTKNVRPTNFNYCEGRIDLFKGEVATSRLGKKCEVAGYISDMKTGRHQSWSSVGFANFCDYLVDVGKRSGLET